MPHTRQRTPYPPNVQQRLNPTAGQQQPPGLGHNTLPPDQLSRIEAGIVEILQGQQAAHVERQHHTQAITAELDDLTGIATKTAERVDTLEQGQQDIRDDHNSLRLEIEQRINRVMWWVLTLLFSGILGLVWTVLKRGVS